MNYIGVNYLSVKDFHMPLDSTQDQINSVMGNSGLLVSLSIPWV